ncbi:serine hydrolase domain-containing protein [Ilumatobacter sp.]|uniref:serine hydrolase domain-containing protein n=1 Tax=Ilumatobacter sp. TaxID=1967498 RepID=UPI003C3DB71B
MDIRQDETRSPLPWILGIVLIAGLLIAGFIAQGSGSSPSTASDDVTAVDTASTDASIASDDTAAQPTAPAPSATTAAPPAVDPTSTSTTAPASSTTLPPTVAGPAPLADGSFSNTAAAFDRLAGANSGASLTVTRGGDMVFHDAAGATIDGADATSDSPMVVASVSKLIVALGIARLDELGLIDVSAPAPWADLDLGQNDGWNDVTVRELLDHTGGVPKAQESWFTGSGISCRDHIPSLLTSPPAGDRGQWVYSNGNYCLLGLVIESVTGEPLDVALQRLVFDPVGASGLHLTGDELLPGDLQHWEGVVRLSQLGGAGTLVVSTDDLATVFDHLSPADRAILQPPGVFTDQYGFGHTGTVTGAKSCVWVLEDGATAVAATISGNSVASGGDICDIVVPAVASDLGLGSAKPDRTP